MKNEEFKQKVNSKGIPLTTAQWMAIEEHYKELVPLDKNILTTLLWGNKIEGNFITLQETGEKIDLVEFICSRFSQPEAPSLDLDKLADREIEEKP